MRELGSLSPCCEDAQSTEFLLKMSQVTPDCRYLFASNRNVCEVKYLYLLMLHWRARQGSNLQPAAVYDVAGGHLFHSLGQECWMVPLYPNHYLFPKFFRFRKNFLHFLFGNFSSAIIIRDIALGATLVEIIRPSD